jgi:RimJ/RimL family protein N-acetyltransferase
MFIRTERLLLRPGWTEDAPALLKAIGDEAIVRNLARAPWPYAIEHAEAFLAVEPRPEEPNFLVFRRTLGAPQLIGGVGIAALDEGEQELGYWIARTHWGLGYATEAASAVVNHARHSLRRKRLIASHFLDNPASGRVLRKLGFRSGPIVSRHSAGRGATVASRSYELAFDGERQANGDAVHDAACQMIAA